MTSGAPNVVVVAGPTASGKSALAICLAEALNGVVINADGIQCYRDLPILTARPSDSDERRVPHRLYGFLEPTAILSATDWAGRAATEIKTVIAAGQRPILVGGNGFYLKALMEGLSDIPPVPDDVRAETRRLLEEIGAPALHARLAERDPVTAARLKPGDTQRIGRAWEVLEATGTSISAWQAQPAKPPLAANYVSLLVQPEREALYQSCDARFLMMLEAGALIEVVALGKTGVPVDAPVMRALGATELAAVAAGKLELAAAVSLAQAATRQYAKRQTTWFRNQFRADYRIETKFLESLFQNIFPEIRHLVLT
ncbi:MAG: tRNA (adenosine(37)-N6)-dimethylallyltransferase MiaA [Rhodospirillaceae bacterium]|nr:tRNA (adenosine(37)-N6)-dimethylallyltransferase MiaA [Rhodospirillaceae bacterium]